MMSLLSFPQRTLVTNALLLTLLAMITSCTAGRTLADEENAEFFLPDAVFIDGQCQTLLAEPIPVPQVQQACAAYKKGEIDGDKWLLRLSPVLRPSRYLSQDCLVFSVYPLRPIPKDYATYSLALFPSTQYQPSEIESIRKTFFAFGNAIGKPHAAIWFQPDQTVRLVTRKEDRQSGQVDHKRSKYYCDRFGLSYNAGPYIVTTQRRPDDVREEDEKIVIQHGGISANRVVHVLNILEQDLRREHEIRRRALLFEEVKQYLLSIADHPPSIVKDIIIKLIKAK